MVTSTHRTFVSACVLGALSLAGTPDLHAADLHVPAAHPSIQAAIDAAVDGDAIVVSPGIYPEALDLLGKSLTLEGTGGAGVTLVDASGLGNSALRNTVAPCVSSVRGLTFTGGSAASGAGVRVTQGTLTFDDCVIRDNATLDVPGAGVGGGVLAAVGSQVVLSGCTLSGNTATTGGGAAGSVTLVDCHVSGNTAWNGGGLANVEAASNCLIEGNHAFQSGGGATGEYWVFESCVFRANTTNHDGGGFSTYLWFSPTGPGVIPSMSDLVFVDNACAGSGGAVYLKVGGDHQALEFSMERVVFQDNFSAEGVDGPHFDVTPSPGGSFRLNQCTFRGDRLGTIGAPISVNSSIFYFHPEPLEPDGFGGPQVLYSDVQGGWTGTGNITANPKFVDSSTDDLRLLPGSPCINTGDPSLPSDADGSRADMGGLAYHPWSDVVGSSLAGHSAPDASANGALTPGSHTEFSLSAGPPFATAFLVLGVAELSAPFKQGVLVPTPDLVLGLPLDLDGALAISFAWPTGIPSGASVWLQWWIADAGAAAGYASSEGLVGRVP